MWLTGQQIGNAAFYERRPLSCRAIHCGVFVVGPIPEQRAEYVVHVALGVPDARLENLRYFCQQ